MVDVIDPSITARIGTGSNNPLTQFGQVVGIQNAMNQNALFQQTYRARAALGPLSQASVGPDGQMDWDKYATLVSTHPDTAWLAPDILNNIAQRKLIDAETTNQKLITTQRRMELLTPFLAKGAQSLDGTPGHDIASLVGEATAAGALDPAKQKEHIAWITQLSTLPIQEQRARLAQQAAVNEQGRATLSAFNGTFTPNLYRDNAGNSYPGWVRSVFGGTAPAGGSAMPGGALPPSQGFPGAQPAAGGGGAAAPAGGGLTLRQPGPQLEESLKYGQSLDTSADYSQRFLNNLKEGEQLLNRAMTGRAIPTRLEIGRWAGSLGIAQDKVDAITGGSSNATQALGKLMLYIGTQGMRQANEGNAAVRSVQEWQKFIEANPNLANDPPAIRQMWDLMKFQSRMVVGEQKAYYKRRDSGGDLTTFRSDWNGYADDKMNEYLRNTKDRDWSQPGEIGE